MRQKEIARSKARTGRQLRNDVPAEVLTELFCSTTIVTVDRIPAKPSAEAEAHFLNPVFYIST